MDNLKFVFVTRVCNRVAHKCARLASTSTPRVEWQAEAPTVIRHFLIHDCNSDNG
jgi:hypothetical protein